MKPLGQFPSLTENGYQRLTVSSSSVGFTVPANTVLALCRVSAEGPVRTRNDGTAPTSSSGFPWYPGEDFVVETPLKLAAFRAIRVQAADTYLDILYYRNT